jgi:signal transduction histidine kinase
MDARGMRLAISPPRRRNLFAAMAVFWVLAGVIVAASRAYQRTLVEESRARVTQQVSSHATALLAAVTQRFELVRGVRAFVQTEGAMDQAHFERFAESLYKSTPGILAICLIRDGVMRGRYPFSAELDKDLSHDKRASVWQEYLRALRTPDISISGPYELVEGKGGLGLVARHAIWEGGKAIGAVAIVLDVAPLLRQVRIDPLPAGLDLALRDRTGSTFHGRAGVFAEDPIVQTIALQDGAWDVAALPRGGWLAGVRRQVLFFRLTGLAFAALIAFVVYLIVQRIAVRQQHVRDLARNEADVWRKAIRVIGHEINNSLAPVTSLLHSAKLMASQAPMPPRLVPALDMIEERAHHLRTFLDGYATLARLPAPVKAPVEWQPFLAELAALYPFEVESASLSVPGHFDRAQVQQVLINLLKNATEAGGPAEEVRLKVEVNSELVISVLDRGAGMKPEHLARVGEPFFTTKRSGTGIGLHLCREIALAHGGAFELLPRAGGGISANLRLPL